MYKNYDAHVKSNRDRVMKFHSVLAVRWLTTFHFMLIKYLLPNVDFPGKSIIAQKCSRKSFALARQK